MMTMILVIMMIMKIIMVMKLVLLTVMMMLMLMLMMTIRKKTKWILCKAPARVLLDFMCFMCFQFSTQVHFTSLGDLFLKLCLIYVQW